MFNPFGLDLGTRILVWLLWTFIPRSFWILLFLTVAAALVAGRHAHRLPEGFRHRDRIPVVDFNPPPAACPRAQMACGPSPTGSAPPAKLSPPRSPGSPRRIRTCRPSTGPPPLTTPTAPPTSRNTGPARPGPQERRPRR